MKERLVQFYRYTLMLVLAVTGVGQTLAQKQVTLATAEREPYIGKLLPEMGYVHEIVTEAFSRLGYEVNIDFYPLARAKLLAENGNVDGIIPAYLEVSLENKLAYSDAFPGDNIGLLKKKDLSLPDSIETSENVSDLLSSLNSYEFGLVRGETIAPNFAKDAFLHKQYVVEDLNNLDKLALDRVQLIVIDKYTAADLMVNQRPHLIGTMDFVSQQLSSNAFHIGFSKQRPNYQQLVADFNEGLGLLKNDGTLARVLAKHGFFPNKALQTEKTILTIGTVNNRDMTTMQKLSKQFESEHPDIELEWRELNEATLRLRLLSDFAIADGQFDIMTIGAYEAPLWAKRDWLVPLSVLPPSYDTNDLLASVRKGLSYNDTLYALPFYAESSATFYRKDLFERAGLTMPDNPSYDDILQFAGQIHDPDNNLYGICLRGKSGWGGNMTLVGTMVNTYGGQWFDQQWRPQINTPEWKSATRMYTDLLLNYGPPNPTVNGFNENQRLFADGHCGIWIDATVAAGLLYDPKRSLVFDKVGIASAPVAVTSKGSRWLWTWALAVSQSSKHKSEAIEFITWATSKGYIEQVAEAFGWISVPPGTRQSTYENVQYQQKAEFSNFVLESILASDTINSTLRAKSYTGIQVVDILEFAAIGNQVGTNIQRVLKGELSLEQALELSQNTVREQMINSGYFTDF